MSQCPFCHEEKAFVASTCPHCNTETPYGFQIKAIILRWTVIGLLFYVPLWLLMR